MKMFDILNVNHLHGQGRAGAKKLYPLWGGFPKERRKRLCFETGCSKHDRGLPAFPKKGEGTAVTHRGQPLPLWEGLFFLIKRRGGR